MFQESGLVKLTYFLSPEYTQKLLGTEKVSRDDEEGIRGIYASPVPDDKLFNWLAENALFGLKRQSFVRDYFFMGSNGALCSLSAIEVNLQQPSAWSLKDTLYQRIVRIKSQPSHLEIPSELINAFMNMKYKEGKLPEKVNEESSFDPLW